MADMTPRTAADILDELRAGLPTGHRELPGVIRAIEVLRHDADADHERRMTAARARAEYDIGDATWAGVIIGAYLNPDADADALRRDMAADAGVITHD